MGLFRRATDPTELDRVKADVVALREAIDQHDERRRLDQLATRIDDLEARITAVATELANQLTELGGELDALAARPEADGVSEQVVGELRQGQVRLASEQARYQIAFRADLAAMVEHLRPA